MGWVAAQTRALRQPLPHLPAFAPRRAAEESLDVEVTKRVVEAIGENRAAGAQPAGIGVIVSVVTEERFDAHAPTRALLVPLGALQEFRVHGSWVGRVGSISQAVRASFIDSEGTAG